MSDKERNRNALRSQRLICEAFVELTRERGKGRITVADVCRTADVNRSTFYAHYDNVDDLQEKIYDETLAGFGDWLAEVLEAGDGSADAFLADPMPALRVLGERLIEALDMMRVLAARVYLPAQSFGMDLRRTLLDVVGPLEGEHLMRFDLIAAALTNVYYTWYDGCYGDMTIDELNALLARYVRRCSEL